MTTTLTRTAHRRATVPDPARLLRPRGRTSYDDDICDRCKQHLDDCVCDDDGLDVQILHLLIAAELDAIRADVAGMRADLDEIRAAARREAVFVKVGSHVYLHASLNPTWDEAEVLARAARALRCETILGPDRARDLALAALRGWTHRQALAGGGVR